jgi:hypothetical protein
MQTQLSTMSRVHDITDSICLALFYIDKMIYNQRNQDIIDKYGDFKINIDLVDWGRFEFAQIDSRHNS